ncbi:WecB/TagA/CpsF family glycosyltransferase [candidate division WWE3 bacterium]|nr:WecB/TagA/CpsF family glycosyltransferase [candidate division WWE3 bacterium]
MVKSNYLDVLRERITGVDLMEEILAKFNNKGIHKGVNKGISVYFVGTKLLEGSETGFKVSQALRGKYRGIEFVGSCSGREEIKRGVFKNVNQERIQAKVLSDLKASGKEIVDFMFVSFGSSRQELWIAKNIGRLPVKVFMGVGGAFDFIGGSKKRAPKWLRDLKLEWVYRLASDLTLARAKRIATAVIYFPLLVYFASAPNAPNRNPNSKTISSY